MGEAGGEEKGRNGKSLLEGWGGRDTILGEWMGGMLITFLLTVPIGFMWWHFFFFFLFFFSLRVLRMRVILAEGLDLEVSHLLWMRGVLGP